MIRRLFVAGLVLGVLPAFFSTGKGKKGCPGCCPNLPHQGAFGDLTTCRECDMTNHVRGCPEYPR